MIRKSLSISARLANDLPVLNFISIQKNMTETNVLGEVGRIQ